MSFLKQIIFKDFFKKVDFSSKWTKYILIFTKSTYEKMSMWNIQTTELDLLA